MASTPPHKRLLKGRLQAPQQTPAPISHTQAPRRKSETQVLPPGSKQVVSKEVPLTTLPHPFVNPGGILSQGT
ncbi:hypothetical protein C8A03DRAFT_15959 [Achaetomium macrosporum]|uniref:Uncharacterized protein n=1 Tax=Achaetomium macrosporum TaxID=79813 RepID=A0AAN7C948_9PEZI|nr:hypothetical protein C8A03DRAFT_15959 [Achaetomium macrosporum]